MYSTIVLVGLLALSVDVHPRMLPVYRTNSQKEFYYFPSFGVITSIDFEQMLRAEMAEKSRARLERRIIEETPLMMKKSIAIGRAGFRPGKRTLQFSDVY